MKATRAPELGACHRVGSNSEATPAPSLSKSPDVPPGAPRHAPDESAAGHLANALQILGAVRAHVAEHFLPKALEEPIAAVDRRVTLAYAQLLKAEREHRVLTVVEGAVRPALIELLKNARTVALGLRARVDAGEPIPPDGRVSAIADAILAAVMFLEEPTKPPFDEWPIQRRAIADGIDEAVHAVATGVAFDRCSGQADGGQ